MSVEAAVAGLLKELIAELEGERAEIGAGEVGLLEERGPRIEGLVARLKDVPGSVGGDEVVALAEVAGRLRKDNLAAVQALMMRAEAELAGVRRGREVCRAYGGGGKEKELFVKREC